MNRRKERSKNGKRTQAESNDTNERARKTKNRAHGQKTNKTKPHQRKEKLDEKTRRYNLGRSVWKDRQASRYNSNKLNVPKRSKKGVRSKRVEIKRSAQNAKPRCTIDIQLKLAKLYKEDASPETGCA